MKYNQILENLKTAIAVRIPIQNGYQKQIATLLGINPKVISRRLSGESIFTTEEISILCEKLNIPPSEIFHSCGGKMERPLKLLLHDLHNNRQGDYQIFEWYVDKFTLAARSDYSRLYVTCNILPDILYPAFNWINRFAILQWLIYNKGSLKRIPLAEINPTSHEKGLMDKYLGAIRSLKSSRYIISNKIIQNQITDMRRFYLSGYITQKETELLISEIEQVIDFFEKTCDNGHLDNGREIEIYITDTFLYGNMYILESDRINFGVMHANQLNPICTLTPDVYAIMKSWFNANQICANEVSLSGTHLRKEFSNTQRQAIALFKEEINR